MRDRTSNRARKHPNPSKNHKWRIGRVQRQARRLFTSTRAKPVSTCEVVRQCYPRLTKFEPWHYAEARRAVARWAIMVGLAARRGAPVVWTPRPEFVDTFC